ncbi:MAG: phosphatidate cytidylyltransferase [Clostridia bacterium]|nr:phosphatidate cytidylyltransferase [Clostridia bacterium]
MKTRIITGLVGLVIVIGWLFSMYTPIFAVVLALVAAIGVYEMIKAFEVKNLVFRILCIAVAALIPLYFDYKSGLNIPLFPVITAVVIISLIIMVLDFENLKFEQVASSLAASVFVPSALSCVILFRDVYITSPDTYKKTDGIFFLLFAFFCCWLSDTFAFFTGKFFGKHKLAPVISPKKTIEGAIGGIVCTAILNVVLFLVFKYNFDLSAEIGLITVIISSVVLSVISIFGDLAASTVKRHHGIKDFGNILPGHGGVMDRFDSSCFVFPVLYSIITVINAI